MDEINKLIIDLLTYCQNDKTKEELIQFLIGNFKLNKEDSIDLFNLLFHKQIFIEVNSFHFRSSWIRNYTVSYYDYSDPITLYKDEQRMKEYLQKQIPPTIIENYNGEVIKLPFPKTHYAKLEDAFLTTTEKQKNNSFQDLNQFLYYSFGAVRKASFFDIMPVLLKFYPSNGARHIFELYIYIYSSSFLAKGLYHYNCLEHTLTKLNHSPANFPNNNRIFITSVFERMQWRYRNSWNYRDVLFEIGHLKQHISLVARAYNINITLLDTEHRHNELKMNSKSILDEDICLEYIFE